MLYISIYGLTCKDFEIDHSYDGLVGSWPYFISMVSSYVTASTVLLDFSNMLKSP